MERWRELLDRGASETGIDLSDEQMEALGAFRDRLLDWNERVNLTALTGDEDVAIKHFLDSLLCVRAIEGWKLAPAGGGQASERGARGGLAWGEGLGIVDVGSGGGFPGVPLAIVRPHVRVVLLESIRKKAEFLARVIADLRLNATVACVRAEDAGRGGEFRERFDVAVARAVAPMRVLGEYCLPLCRVGGLFVAMKGPCAGREVAEATRAIALMGGGIAAVTEYELPFGMGSRALVLMGKERPTPPEYPRRVGVPARRPL